MGEDYLNKLAFSKCKGLYSLVCRANAALMHRTWVRIPLKSPFSGGGGEEYVGVALVYNCDGHTYIHVWSLI